MTDPSDTPLGNGTALDRRALLVVAALSTIALPTIAKVQEFRMPAQGQFANVNGLRMYYEVHGTGRPLVLLHGGGPAVGAFGPSIPVLAAGRQIIAVHLQGHGHTRDIDRPFRYETMADDIAVLLDQLGLRRTDVLGYSLGGGVALQTAIRHPERVDRLVCVSTVMKQDGSYPEILATFEQMDANAPINAANLEQSPFAEMYPDVDWVVLFRKVGDMNRRPFDWSREVAQIKSPAMLVFADADSIRPEHIVEFWRAVGGGRSDAGIDGSLRPRSRLAIIPGTTHYGIMADSAVAQAAAAFLDQVDT